MVLIGNRFHVTLCIFSPEIYQQKLATEILKDCSKGKECKQSLDQGSGQSHRHGGLWWAYPPKQSSKPPKIET